MDSFIRPVVLSPSIVQGRLTQARSKSKMQKQKKRWSAKSSRNPLSLDKVTPASQSQNQKKAAREASGCEAETLAPEGLFGHVDKVAQHVLLNVVFVRVIVVASYM
jgi:hypothetical protein